MKIGKDVYHKPQDQLNEQEKDFLLGAWSLRDLDNFAKICENARNIYANVESVSKSGTRKISFYCIGIDGNEPYIKRLNRFIRCFNLANGKTKEDFLHSMNIEKKKFLDRDFRSKRYAELDEPIKTSVCGMDAIFAELHPIFSTLKRLGYEKVSDDASSYRIL